MKKFYALLLSLVIPFAALFANENELHVSGMVYENPEIPVPGYQVNIEIPPSNVFDGYFNEVLTNDEGFYVDEILLPENVTQGEIFLSTVDCNGEIITEMFVFSPELMEIEHDFLLCDEPFPDCEASFLWEPLEGNVIQFFNTSLPDNINSIWEFGDGVTSTEFNPVHEYAEQGVYEVCLLIYNDELNCEDEFCMDVIVGNNTGCEAWFDWGPAPDNPMVIAFFNQSVGDELEYLWDFGDGETSDEMNPVHDYAEPGVYDVCLEITGENCQDTYCTEVNAENGQFECMASFEYEAWDDLSVQFFNTSFPENVFTVWDFGDNQGSEEPNPIHQYAEAGVYNVCLLIYNDELNCEDQFCMEVFVGNNNNCEAFFMWEPDPNSPLTISFFNASFGGEELEYMWDFGDGETSNEMNPVHNYAEPGVYPVCLEIFGENCQDSYCTEVFVDEWPGECMAMFEFEILEDNAVQFFNFSFPPDGNYLWEFGDGTTSEEFEPIHVYDEPGDYEVCLTVWSEQFNCEDQMCMELAIGGGGGGECEAYYTWWPTDEPLTIQFMDFSWIENGQYHWEFGDGTTGEGPMPAHTYQVPGVYEVCLVAYNDGCEDVYCEEVIVEGNGGGGECEAGYEWQQLDGLQIQFMNTSWPQQAEFYWDFGDDNAYWEHSPVHLYDEPGQYEVCLTMFTADGCEDLICQEVVVEGQGGGGLTASFEIEIDPENPLTLHFWDTSNGEPTEWLWEFGDGTTSDEQNPMHSYEEGGSYTICLTVGNNNNDPDTWCTGVELNEAYFSSISEIDESSFMVYPNPVIEEATIEFVLTESQEPTLEVYNTLMQKVRSIEAGVLNAGKQSLRLPVTDLQEGIYMVSLKINGKYYTEKIIVSH